MLHRSRHSLLLYGLLALFIIAVASIVFVIEEAPKDAQIACTQEAKICPDGSSVGRTGPACEFAACPVFAPAVDETTDWKTATDAQTGDTFKYPAALPTFYSEASDWPPKLAVTKEPFFCKDSGSEITALGKISSVQIAGKAVCITAQAEGAAGSTYITYTYRTAKDDYLISLTFTVREVQCLNYDQPQQSACLTERNSFDLNSLANKMLQSVVVSLQQPPTSTASSTMHATTGVIEGMVMRGPNCPVLQNPPDPQCADTPYAADLSLFEVGKSVPVQSFTSKADGTFSITAMPGTFMIAQSAQNAPFPRCSTDGSFTVVSNKTTKVAVSCDTGIR